MSSKEASVWVVRPQDVSDDEMGAFKVTLDATELRRAKQFRFESDRRAYVVAHGLRRLVLGDLLGVHAARLIFSIQDNGKPSLNWPEDSDLFFSHSHTRGLVAFAVGTSPLGIDVECVAGIPPALDLLEPYLALPRASKRISEIGPDPADQFFFYWTALEAFWKADGEGLSSNNPRIRCEKNREGQFEVRAELGHVVRTGPPLACVSRIQSPLGFTVSLAQRYVPGGSRQTVLHSPYGSCPSSKKDKVFQPTKRYKGSGVITIVSV
jgi:phosphopantetheinyl transferase